MDDNIDVANSMMMVLEKAGHSVEVAFNGEEGLEKAERLKPQLVLMDLGMPGMNGYEVCQHLRARSWGQRSRIVAISGWGQPEDRERSRSAGFDEHLVKPIESHTVDRLLKHVQQ